MKNNEISWLSSITAWWDTAVAQERLPHAVMLLGASGLGKRCAAAWMASARLSDRSTNESQGSLPAFPLIRPTHADLHWLSIPDDKKSIGVDQIRRLVDELSLTSYEGRGKVAIIEPADAMTVSAANSLLKTLEEPPGDTLIVLVADQLGRLPATVLSRCQRLNVHLPEPAIGEQWLQSVQPQPDWMVALEQAGYAPLAALRERDLEEERQAMRAEFMAVGSGQAAPLPVAERWSKLGTEFVLTWLARQVQAWIRAALVEGATAGGRGSVNKSVLEHIDRQNLFCYLDIINRVRGQQPGSFNVQLTLESLLIDWAQGLRRVALRE